jgi:hypothetical protein
LFALDLVTKTRLPLVLYTLASPRVGDLTFHNLFNHVVPDAYRVANRLDIVPKTPPPLLYFHVRDETDLLPSSAMTFDLACEHQLSSYLNMLAALVNRQASLPIDDDCLKQPPAAQKEV